MSNKIYTRSEAADIIELFENVLSAYNIHIPSPEDDEREEDNMFGLYGSTYYELLDSVEEAIISILKRKNNRTEIITDEFKPVDTEYAEYDIKTCITKDSVVKL